MSKIRNISLLFIIFVVVLISCSDKKIDTRDPAELFSIALESFEDEDWIDAKAEFELIKLQFTASEYADDAQFYLGEVEFYQKQYIVAAYNYNALLRNYPGSEFTKISSYKAAECYYELSPPYDRDQQYTKKAIQAFQDFQYLYPSDSLSNIAEKRIEELRNKLAHREYFTGTLYMNMESPLAAEIYFDTVLRSYEDTEYYEPAYFGKIEALMKMKKYEEARGTINLYQKLFPDKNTEEIKVFIAEINEFN